MSFGEFLEEAEEAEDGAGGDKASGTETAGAEEDSSSSSGSGENADAADKSSNSEKSDGKDKDEKNDIEQDADSTEDANTQSNYGYFVTYGLKVEGFKNRAVKDSLKKIGKVLGKKIFKILDNIGLKLSGGGLWGSGGEVELSVGGAREKIKKIGSKALGWAFSKIDPDELVDNVSKEINKIKYPNSNVEVNIRNSKELVLNMGK